ncbi:uncharacterized protein LOC134688138 [Mytilus trossulus]|uniref:uncharacterized protein LOC134688138 n=1 Tax=Mytilus trossulus TaxID=6551 RepID=UPI0030073D1E
MFTEIEDIIVDTNLQVCLLGDFNAHTKNVNEYVDIDNHILNACNIANDYQNLINKLHILEECNVSPVSYSKDNGKIDHYGKRLFNLYKSTQLFFVNGRFGADKDVGQTTCNNSLIDYVIITPELSRAIVDFDILSYDPILSDVHKPVCLKLCSNIRSDCVQCGVTGSSSEKDVVDAIKTLKNDKACSNDMILNEFLKHGAVKLLPVYVKIFNIIFVPDSWSQGFICPIYKNKGDPASADNYRGITILSCYGKLFTCILNNRFFNYLECLGLLCEEQAGFRKGYGTVDHILNLKCLIDMYLFRRKKLYCAFVDYRNAFDSVNRVLLWQKLLRNGIDGKMLVIVQNLYKNAKSCVRSGSNISELFASNVGVRQGEKDKCPLHYLIQRTFESQ